MSLKTLSIKKMTIIAVLAVIVILYFLLDPEKVNIFPACPFFTITGLKCPGCGSQRALHHLLNLDLFSAFLKNPLLIISIPYMLLGVIFDSSSSLVQRFPKTRNFFFGQKAILTVFVIVVSYWILRNIFDF